MRQDIYQLTRLSHQRDQVLARWGFPKTEEDISNLFLRYLHSKLTTTPFSPEPLSPESLMIIRHLERLTKKGWWTVGSQPAVDGAKSSDEVVGWGPNGGYVYQKSFVEFFVEQDVVDRIKKKVRDHGQGWVDYFAGNLEGNFRSNVPEGGRNAVTWGIFPGQEVAQSTIIEKESFLTWKVCKILTCFLSTVYDSPSFVGGGFRHLGRVGVVLSSRLRGA